MRVERSTVKRKAGKPRAFAAALYLLPIFVGGMPWCVQAADSSASTPTTTAPSSFRLGTHYQQISPVLRAGGEQANVVEVVEVFWYGCGHCDQFEPHFQKWAQSAGSNVRVIRVPAVFSVAKFHAQAFYTAEVLGKDSEMHQAFFDEIHRRGNKLDDEQKLGAFFARFGVSEAEFKRAFASAEVQAKLQRALELTKGWRMTFVPWIVVDGRYSTSATKAGGNAELLQLMTELTTRANRT